MANRPTANSVKKMYWGKDHGTVEVKNPPTPKRLWPCPQHLTGDSRRFYKRVGKILLEQDMLTELSRSMFEHMALLYGRIRRMDEQITIEGEVISDSKGSLKRHPAIMVQQGALSEFRVLCSELGLTPYSMNKLGVNLTVKKDETASFLFGDEDK